MYNFKDNESLMTTVVDTVTPTTSTEGVVGQFYIDQSTDPASLYLCTKVETVDSTTTYTWTKQGGKQLYQHNIRLGYKNLYTIVISDNSEPFTYTTLSEWLSNKGFTENYRGYFVYGDSDTFNISGTSYYSNIPIFLRANSDGTNLMLVQYKCTDSPKGNVTIDDVSVSYITNAVWSSVVSSYLNTTITDTVVAL